MTEKMTDCIFCKIAQHEMPTKIIYESDYSVVFSDIEPLAPIHLLIIPKKHLNEFYTLVEGDHEIEEDLKKTIRKMIEKYDLMNKGYRIATNGGGAQAINHFHIHLLGQISRERQV